MIVSVTCSGAENSSSYIRVWGGVGGVGDQQEEIERAPCLSCFLHIVSCLKSLECRPVARVMGWRGTYD